MSRTATYQAGLAAASTIEAHFVRHLSQARARGERDLAPAPNARAVQQMIDATFWASLRPEESRFPKITLAFLSPEQAGTPLRFEQPLPLVPQVLTKLAPAVERPGIHLAVWYRDGAQDGPLMIWGVTRTVPSFGFVLEDVEPGLLVIKHRRASGFGKYANVAVLMGEQVKVIDEQGTSLPDCPALLKALLAFNAAADPAEPRYLVNVLVQLAASMRAHGRGGSLLVVPSGDDEWRKSIVHPVLYSVAPSFSSLAELVKLDEQERVENSWETAVRKAVDTVAGLTAVDGATVINERYEVMAFGAKIHRSPGNAQVEQMVLTEPVIGNQAVVVPPVQHGGTRHLSAAQFVHDQREALALVASQDGRFTVFAWSPCENMVHAHRVDTLLL
ncbi:MAG TPA: hypothetical protein VJT50_10085 [Pyrinomonadaceae bacterium]|nr:hypothetical protein [Pyrinomonadaceae bacterium]